MTEANASASAGTKESTSKTAEKKASEDKSESKSSNTAKSENDEVRPGMTIGYASGPGAEVYSEGMYDSDEVNKFYNDRAKKAEKKSDKD